MVYEVTLIGGPFDAVLLPMPEAPKEELGLPIDGNGVATRGTPFGLAIYTRELPNQYNFSRYEAHRNSIYPLIFADGPAANGERPEFQRPSRLLSTMIVSLANDSTVMTSDVSNDPTAGAVYQLKPVNGVWKYVLESIDRSPEMVSDLVSQANEMRAQSAARAFYKAPNYDIYSVKPTGDHVQVPVEVGHRRGHVDEQIAGVIKRLWSIGLDTLGSCQSRPATATHPHEAYIQFPLKKSRQALSENPATVINPIHI